MLVSQSCLTFCDSMDFSSSMEFSRQEYWSGLSFPTPSQKQRVDQLLPGEEVGVIDIGHRIQISSYVMSKL